MKRTSIRLAHQYEAALRKYLALGSRTGLPLADRPGKQARVLGLSALDLARLHDRALGNIDRPFTRNGHWADAFFARACTQLARTSPSGRNPPARVRQLNEQLRQRTIDLARLRLDRKQGLIERRALKNALKKKTECYACLLAESRDLQDGLRSLTRRMLASQENERTTMSRSLHDEVAQAMLSIQVRLAHLKRESARNTTGLNKELSITQRLVEKSAKTLNRSTGKLRKP